MNDSIYQIREKTRIIRQSSYQMTDEGEMPCGIFFVLNSGEMRCLNYRDLHLTCGDDESLYLEFETGVVTVTGKWLERINWLIAENRLLSLSAAKQSQVPKWGEPVVHTISYVPLEKLTGNRERENQFTSSMDRLIDETIPEVSGFGSQNQG